MTLSNKLKTILSFTVSAILIILIIGKIIDTRSNRAETIRSEKLLIEILGTGNQLMIGDEMAKKSLIVYFDYNCKYCSDFFINSLPKIDKRFISTNKLNVILKPVNIGKNKAISDAYQLLYCLNNMGLFNEMHSLLLKIPDAIFTSEYEIFMNSLLFESPEIAECMEIKTMNSDIKINKEQLLKLGNKTTPTFVLENKVYSGKISIETISEILNKK